MTNYYLLGYRNGANDYSYCLGKSTSLPIDKKIGFSELAKIDASRAESIKIQKEICDYYFVRGFGK